MRKKQQQVEKPQEVKVSIVEKMDADRMKQILGWEEEDEENGIFFQDFLLITDDGVKVRCTNNVGNRPFDHATSKKYRQEILNKRWELNGETFIITDEGHVASGQHRGIALVEAQRERQNNPMKWDKIWGKEQVTIPVILVEGISSKPNVIRTLDVTRPRTLADVLITTEAIGKKVKTDAERREFSRLMANAIDLIWKRTQPKTETETYQTHSASLEWLKRHPKFIEGALHIFEENRDRSISLLRLSAGQCAALLYLFATSESDRSVYTKTYSEKNLNLSRMDKACEFFTELAKGNLQNLEKELAALVDPNDGSPGPQSERRAIVVKAWNEWIETGQVTETCRLDVRMVNGVMRVVEFPTAGGIDLGEKPSSFKGEDEEEEPASPPPTLSKMTEKAANKLRERHESLKEDYDGILLYEHEDGYFDVWEDDAEVVAAACDGVPANVTGLRHFRIEKPDIDMAISRLGKHKIYKVKKEGEDTFVTQLKKAGGKKKD